MIKFFRNIRRSLIQDNKMGKYFKYAIGEILLVVIGILIALQINNWNENRKANAYEENMLSEILTTLNNDIDFFNRLEDRIKKKDTAIDNLLYARANKRKFTDENLRDYIYWAGAGIIISCNTGPYEALKSGGLDKIKTDSLRFKLTDYYEFYLPRGKAFFQDAEDFYSPSINAIEKELEENGFFEQYFELMVENNIEKGYVPRTKFNLNKYLNEPSYNKYLILNAQYKREIWQYVRSIISRSKKLSKAIEQELKERFNHE